MTCPPPFTDACAGWLHRGGSRGSIVHVRVGHLQDDSRPRAARQRREPRPRRQGGHVRRRSLAHSLSSPPCTLFLWLELLLACPAFRTCVCAIAAWQCSTASSLARTFCWTLPATVDTDITRSDGVARCPCGRFVRCVCSLYGCLQMHLSLASFVFHCLHPAGRSTSRRSHSR